MLNLAPTFISTVQSTKGYAWLFTCQDSAGNIIDLTNATLAFIIQSVEDFEVNSANAMAIVNAVAGQCSYVVEETDFPIPGNYTAQIQVSYGSMEVFKFDGISITVTPALPQA